MRLGAEVLLGSRARAFEANPLKARGGAPTTDVRRTLSQSFSVRSRSAMLGTKGALPQGRSTRRLAGGSVSPSQVTNRPRPLPVAVA